MRSVLTGKEPVDRVKELVLDEHEECGCECSPELASLCAGQDTSHVPASYKESLSVSWNWVNLSQWITFCTLKLSFPNVWMSPYHVYGHKVLYHMDNEPGDMTLIFEQRKISRVFFYICFVLYDEMSLLKSYKWSSFICSGFEKINIILEVPPHHQICDCIIITASAAMQQVLNFIFPFFNFDWNGNDCLINFSRC